MLFKKRDQSLEILLNFFFSEFEKEKKLYSLRLCKASGVCGFDGANPNMNILKSPSFKKKYVKINPKCFILSHGVLHGKTADRGMNNGHLIKTYW